MQCNALSINGWYVMLKALMLVCTKYTAQSKSWVANIAQGSKCYICHASSVILLYLLLDSHFELYI